MRSRLPAMYPPMPLKDLVKVPIRMSTSAGSTPEYSPDENGKQGETEGGMEGGR